MAKTTSGIPGRRTVVRRVHRGGTTGDPGQRSRPHCPDHRARRSKTLRLGQPSRALQIVPQPKDQVRHAKRTDTMTDGEKEDCEESDLEYNGEAQRDTIPISEEVFREKEGRDVITLEVEINLDQDSRDRIAQLTDSIASGIRDLHEAARFNAETAAVAKQEADRLRQVVRAVRGPASPQAASNDRPGFVRAVLRRLARIFKRGGGL